MSSPASRVLFSFTLNQHRFAELHDMVHAEVRPLLALALEGLEHAKRLFVGRLVVHFVTLALLIVSAVALSYHEEQQEPALMLIELGSAGAAVATELLALRLHHRAMEIHSLSRVVMRRVMLMDASRPDPQDTKHFYDHIKEEFPTGVRSSALALEQKDKQLPDQDQRLANYYLSDRDDGPKRLRDHLLESAIFSHHLYSFAWKSSFGLMIALLVGAIVVWRFLLLGQGLVAFRVLVAVMAFLPLSQELDHVLLYKLMANQLSVLLGRLEHLFLDRLSAEQLDLRLMADFGDYGAATTFAPPIRTSAYFLLAKKLRSETKTKLDELKKAEQSAATTS
jgi:hypothetical protein